MKNVLIGVERIEPYRVSHLQSPSGHWGTYIYVFQTSVKGLTITNWNQIEDDDYVLIKPIRITPEGVLQVHRDLINQVFGMFAQSPDGPFLLDPSSVIVLRIVEDGKITFFQLFQG